MKFEITRKILGKFFKLILRLIKPIIFIFALIFLQFSTGIKGEIFFAVALALYLLERYSPPRIISAEDVIVIKGKDAISIKSKKQNGN